MMHIVQPAKTASLRQTGQVEQIMPQNILYQICTTSIMELDVRDRQSVTDGAIGQMPPRWPEMQPEIGGAT